MAKGKGFQPFQKGNKGGSSSQPKNAMPVLGKGKAKAQPPFINPGPGPAGHRNY